jgi:hypothetical protein
LVNYNLQTFPFKLRLNLRLHYNLIGRIFQLQRIHLFEFLDLPWYPQTFRRMQTDYLQFAASMGMGHQNLVPLLSKAMQHAGTAQIVDLCSGGSGPWMRLQEHFKRAGLSVSIKLTDKYPHPEAVHKWAGASPQGIEYLSEPVDAMQVPPHLKGMRTLFEGFHHLSPSRPGASCGWLRTGQPSDISKPA